MSVNDDKHVFRDKDGISNSWKYLTTKYCPRCIARFACSDLDVVEMADSALIMKHLMSNFLVQPDKDLDRACADDCNTVDVDTETNGSNPPMQCCRCLGLLQDSFLEQALQTVKTAVSEDSYEFKTFQVVYCLPAQLVVFEHVGSNEIRSALGKDVEETKAGDVKQTMRVIFDKLVATGLNSEKKIESCFDISLKVSHNQSMDSILKLMQAKKVPDSHKFKRKWHNRSKWRRIDCEEKTRARESLQKTCVTIGEVSKLMAACEDEELADICSPSVHACEIKVELLHAPIFVGGRYNKYSRTLPQTPWFIDGERKIENSVEEYIAAPIERRFKADSHSFASSGREDIDVRMLGSGRPFIVELHNPRVESSTLSAAEWKRVEAEINAQTGDLQVSGLQAVSKAQCARLKEGEEKKTKSYTAACRFLSPPSAASIAALVSLASLGAVVIQQKTPVRVLHRRPLATRARTVHAMSATRTDERCFRLALTTQAGTYIKEFVHGDSGRTRPALGCLLRAPVDIVALDVDSVNVEWP